MGSCGENWQFYGKKIACYWPPYGVFLFSLDTKKEAKKVKAVEPTIAIGVKILAGPWAAALARNPKLHHFSRLKQWLASSPMLRPTTLFDSWMGAKIFQCHSRTKVLIGTLAKQDKCMLLASLRGVTFCLDAKSNQKDQGCGRFWLGREPPPWRAIQNSLRSNNGLLHRQCCSPLVCSVCSWVPKFSNATLELRF